MKIDVPVRVQQAASFFEQGYNCSQSVFMAYSDLYGIDKVTAAKLATSFGGGMGRLREICGALSGAFLVLGLHYPYVNVSDRKSKNENYKVVQKVANDFKLEMGSYICADLLKVKREAQSPESAERTLEYYESRPCIRCVKVAARIIGEEITSDTAK